MRVEKGWKGSKRVIKRLPNHNFKYLINLNIKGKTVDIYALRNIDCNVY